MRAKILVALLCSLTISISLIGCANSKDKNENAQESTTEITQEPDVKTEEQIIEIDTSKLEEAADKLNKAAEKISDIAEKESETEYLHEPHRILILAVMPDGQDFSDRTQADNALKNGGQIVIKGFAKEDVDKAFTDDYGWYGAVDAAGYSFTRGDVLNWISVCGWEFVGTDSYGSSTDYYFRR